MQTNIPTLTRQPDSHQRVLVVARGAFPAEEPAAAQRVLATASGADVYLIAPALAVAGERRIIDLDARERQARVNLASWLEALSAQAHSVRGDMADENPRLAVRDALDEFPADKLHLSRLAGTDGPEPAPRGWVERLGRLSGSPRAGSRVGARAA